MGFAPDDITRKVIRLVVQKPDHWGATEGFDLPVTREQAEACLDDFLAHRLERFGPYEDAMLKGEAWLYHSRLSAAMNVGLLHPATIVERTLARWQDHRAAPSGASPPPRLASVEGFLRQIIGWREYVNGIYWLTMPGYREHNYFEFARSLPRLYWEPDRTDMACLREAAGTVPAESRPGRRRSQRGRHGLHQAGFKRRMKE